MLQGMRKPVNDLSRGALVDDIVYTVALTAIQSSGLTLPPRRNSSPNETRAGIAGPCYFIHPFSRFITPRWQ